MQAFPPSVEIAGQQGQQNPYGNALREVDADDFLKMMITELQNQDPLDPMDNRQILEQIGQIREIVSNDRLTETLEAAFLGQNLATASKMMGQWIVTLADDGESVLAAGRVDQVSIEDGVPKLHVGSSKIKLKDISVIQSEVDALKLAAAMDMIGQKIRAITDDTPSLASQEVVGNVDRVSFNNGLVKLHIEDHTIDPDNVLEILDGS